MSNEGAYFTNENIKKSLDYLIDNKEYKLWRQLTARIQTLIIVTAKGLKK